MGSIRIAAAGDVHAAPASRESLAESFARVAEAADLLLLAGDLTTEGEPEQAAALADACRELELPVLAVLGNHDWHADRADEVIAALESAGVRVLERAWARVVVDGVEVGIAGAKGFVGGFPGSHLPDFGEPLLRRVYDETGAEAKALDAGLRAIASCAVRIALLHYAPCPETLAGEPPEIWTYLGSDRLAGPIREHEPDLVVHGHAHAGTFAADLDGVPVYNVSLPVLERDFWVFEVDCPTPAASGVH